MRFGKPMVLGHSVKSYHHNVWTESRRLLKAVLQAALTSDTGAVVARNNGIGSL
jgi:hypothetical protein